MQRDNKTSGWVDFYRNNKETRNPIKLNQDLFNKGIVAISYRNTNPDQFANQSMITLGNRTFAQYRRIESCVIISVKTDLTIDEILDEERLITPFNNEFPFNDEVVSDNHAITTLLKKMESAYILTNTNLYFVKKTIDNKLEISVLNFHEKNNLEALRTKLTQLKQPKLSSTHSFLNQNITVLFEFENASPSATPLKIINSMTGHHLNDGPSTDKQKKLLDWLTKDNKQITYNKKNCLGNIKRREEVFIPVAVHSKEKTGFNIYPWTSTNFPDAPFRGFKQVVTAGCMFGSYFLGLIKLYDTAKKMLKHDLQFTGKEKITDVVCIEGKNPYEEIIFNDFRRLLSILQAFNEKVKLTYHLPYVDYMLFGIKLFLHNRISIDALHKFFIEILKEKNVYETRLTEMIKSLNLEELIALDIQSPFSPLLQLINIDSSQTLEDSLSALGVDVNAVNFPSEEDNAAEEERHIRGFKQEKLLVRNCIKFLKENEAPGSQKIWDDLIDSQPFIKIFLSDDPALISFIEDNFIEDNIFYNPTILSLLSNFPDIKTIKELINNYPVLKNLCQDSTLNFLDNIDQGRSVKNLINSCPDKKTFISLMTNLLKKHDAEVKKLVSKHLNHKNFLINDLKQVLDSRSNEELKELKDLTNQYVAIKNLKKLLKYPAINELVTNNISIKEFMETPLKNIIDAIINESLTSFNHDLSETNINLIYNYPNPLNQSLIECSFDLANLLFLLREAQETQEKKKKPFETCSFLSATEKQIQSSFQLFQKKYKGYAPIINLTYFDTVLTYDAQNEKKSPNLTNTTGLAFYFYYPSTDLLNNELSYLLPLANDNLVAFATQENEKTLQNNHRTYSIQGNSMFHRQKSVPQLPAPTFSEPLKNAASSCRRNYG